MKRSGRSQPRAIDAGSLDEQLLAVATRRFATDGYAATSMRDIADELNVAVAAAYHHFVNKADILQEIVERGYRDINGRLSAVASDVADPSARLEALVREVVLTMYESFEFATAARFDRRAIFESMGDRYRELRQVPITLLEVAITDGQQSGELRDDIDHRTAERLISGMWNWMPDWLVPRNEDGERLAAVIGRIAHHGVVSPEPVTGVRAGRTAIQRSERRLPRATVPVKRAPARMEPVPTATVVEARRAVRLRQIHDAAAKGFAETGYDAAGVTELCQWTGIARGALYRYIGSKQELLAAVITIYLDDLTSRIEAIEFGEPSATLVAWATAVLSAQHEHADYARVVMNERRALAPDRRDLVAVRLGVVDAVPRAVIPRLPELVERPDDSTNALLGIVHASYLWMRADGLSPAELAERAVDVFLHGMARPSRPGPRQ